MNLLSISHGELHWIDSFPPSFKAVRLPGSTIATSIGDFGSVCIQEFSTENFFIRFNVFDLLQQFVVKPLLGQPGLFAKTVIKGRSDLVINKKASLAVRQNQFILLKNENIIKEETYENRIHITCDTFLSDKLAKELKELFPSPDDQPFVKWSGTETTQIVHSILRCKYENELRRHFFESRVKDIFFNFLFIITNNDSPELSATEKELKAIWKAEEIITADISLHYPIPDLSKQVLLNEFRLKLLFKKIFGTGPYEYLINKRLETGKELLQTGLSIKEVAAKVGYRPSDFTTAFRNRFGFPPGQLKKRNS